MRLRTGLVVWGLPSESMLPCTVEAAADVIRRAMSEEMKSFEKEVDKVERMDGQEK